MKIRNVDLHADEFLAAIAGELTPEQLGVYWMICLLIYSRGGPIVEDLPWLRRLFVHTNVRGIRACIDRLVELNHVKRLAPETDQTLTKLSVNRCETELKLARNRVETWRKHGLNGGPVSAETNGLDSPRARAGALTTNHQPLILTPLNPPTRGGTDFSKKSVGKGGNPRANGTNPRGPKPEPIDPGVLPAAPWAQRCRSWAKGASWHHDWGPPPGEDGCWAPPDLAANAVAKRNSRHEPRAAE